MTGIDTDLRNNLTKRHLHANVTEKLKADHDQLDVVIDQNLLIHANQYVGFKYANAKKGCFQKRPRSNVISFFNLHAAKITITETQ
ncbi:MAG: hypothetical protein P8O69_14335 [Amylibacter sp.]|nr:hypothetical protein [Amylibacter sp.]|tara:strand:+ start:24 stop:281 length:258 start_codon:yes stop_codon:yes gene_type:complete